MKKLITLVIISLLIFIMLLGYSTNVNSSLSQNIVRLHVIANSDSKEDQELKLKVRDALLKQTSSDFTKKAEVSDNLDIYKKIAEETIHNSGFNYSVRVEYGNFSFPTKHYENLSLPAGNYDAVRVVIGNGMGKNWWCVLFPPLCFVDGTTDKTNASLKMKELLSKSNYDLITSQNENGKIPVEIKFKIVELYGGLFSRDKVYAKAGKDKKHENENTRAS
ncbi:MAG: stage II sporulation protein R [Clostridia bacterium]|nr:stage II sporulation protein R [Clostridia bacterium]